MTSLPESLLDYLQREGEEYCASRDELTLLIGLTQEGNRQILPFRSPEAKYAPVPDDKTLYEIGSFSKVFTTSLLSVLVDQGVLSLDDTIEKYYRNWT